MNILFNDICLQQIFKDIFNEFLLQTPDEEIQLDFTILTSVTCKMCLFTL